MSTTLVREPKATPIGQFTVPYKGTWQSIAVNIITPDALYNSMNVYIREGKLRSRPGLTALSNAPFTADVIGGGLAIVGPGLKFLLAFTFTGLYTLQYALNDWIEYDIAAIAAGNNSIVDICFLQSASQYYTIIANNETALKQWYYGSTVETIVASVGTVPIAKSVCIAASRVVALVAPHTLRWTNTLTVDGWSDLNYNIAAETADTGICVRSLNSLDFVLYKERSIYLGKAQAGSDARAFIVKRVDSAEGPAGVHAVVDANGTHFYITTSGRIGMFDGTQKVQWIGDGIWFYLQSVIDRDWMYKAFGVFDYRLHTVVFYYPRLGDDGAMKGMVTINLPLSNSGIADFACFLGLSAIAMSYGTETRFEPRFTNELLDRSVLFGVTTGLDDGQSYTFDETAILDDELPFDCSMQTGLIAMTDMRHHQVSLEVFLERAQGNGSVQILIVTSDVLETPNGTTVPTDYVTLGLEFNPVREYIGFNQPTRFAGLAMSWSSTDIVRYAGAIVHGRMIG